MQKYGFEHLRYSHNTYKQRQLMLIIGCLSILIFEYHITKDLTIYNVAIPNPLIKLSLILAAAWTTIQFLFSSIDDFIDWKKNFLIDEKIGRKIFPDQRSVLIEIESFSKGKIKHMVNFGLNFAGDNPKTLGLKEAEMAFKSGLENLEKVLKNDIKTIENFKKWYKRYSWITIFRFAVLEFALPLVFILYAVVICQFYPILPK
jgi:hypothetical protein